MRCLSCAWYKYDFFDRSYDDTREPFCGLHGGVKVNLDNRGGCGYCPKVKVRQLKLF